ncbi:MAG TPA: glycosyltransferase, partial [Gemmatimonadales bacterium]|nr:glycosyltransferase [Gemmatimonadales bacterium]
MPALAIAQALRERRPDIEPVLVGARRGVDASILAGRPFRYHLLPAEPFYRRQWWKNARWAFLAPGLYVKARALLAHERPAVVVGTGGYAAAPVLSAAARRHLPVVLQEQNAVPGLTTRWFARFARLIYLGFPEAASRLAPGPHTGVHVVGNPVAPPPAGLDRRDARERLGLAPDAPV